MINAKNILYTTKTLNENVLINFKKNLIVISEKKKDNITPSKTKKLNSTFSLNKSFIPRALAPIKAGMDR